MFYFNRLFHNLFKYFDSEFNVKKNRQKLAQ